MLEIPAVPRPTRTHRRTPHLQRLQVKGQKISKGSELPEHGPVSPLGALRPATDAYSTAKSVLPHASPWDWPSAGTYPYPFTASGTPSPTLLEQGAKRTCRLCPHRGSRPGWRGWRLCSCTYLPGWKNLLDVVQVDAIPVF